MPHTVRFLPDDKQAVVKQGVSLLEAARHAGISIRTRCGGKAGCLMCKVQVDTPHGLTTMKPNEERKLGSLKDQGYRLACQAGVIGNVTVSVPEDPLKAAVRKQLAKQKEDDWF